MLKVGGAGVRSPLDAAMPSLVRGREAQVNPGGFTTLREGHRCRIERPVAETPPASADGRSSPSLPDGSNPPLL